MKLKTTLFAAAATLAIAPAAQAYEGWYGSIGAGVSVAEDDIDFEAVSGPVLFDQDIDYRAGVAVATALGYDYGNDWRFEFEFTYRDNQARFIPGDNAGFPGFSRGFQGDITSQAYLVNVVRDFDTDRFVTPFIGLGVGIARISGQGDGSTSQNTPVGQQTIAYDDGFATFAAQAKAGLAFELAEDLALELSYRYLYTQDRGFTGTFNGAGAEFRTHFNGHAALAALRWNFGSAPAPAPAPVVQYKDCWDGSSVPVSAECPPQLIEEQAEIAEPIQFTVYFDYDKSNLTPEAANLVREAASRAQQFDVDTVVVTGNTDTSGGAAYNQRLSERRASVVRDALIANGVSADAIRLEARGENNLAKPTPDGVREPLNRRTDVVISFE